MLRLLARVACLTLALCAYGLAEPTFAEKNYLGDIGKQEILNAKPGQILRVWPQIGGGEDKANAFRIMYRSTGLDGQPIPVSGSIFIPAGPAPRGGRPVVAWAHPTSGVVPSCAPSLIPDQAASIAGLELLLERGYVVTATDYPGLGTPPWHPYLVGVSEGRAVLDSVRAVHQLSDAKARKQYAVWGHSQGGHAALFAGQLAAEYAPELELVGVAAAAPATYLAELFNADEFSNVGKTLSAMALLSWSHVFDIPLSSILVPGTKPAFERVARDCLRDLQEMLKLEQATNALRTNFLKYNPTKVEPWASIMKRNSPGQSPPGAPLFIAQGTADTTVRPNVTKQFANHVCVNGGRVHMIWLEGVDHMYAGFKSAYSATEWMAARFAGKPAPSNCGER